MYAAVPDSLTYFYAGNTSEIKNVYNTLKVGYKDSSIQNSWGAVYTSDYQPVLKTISINKQVMPDVKGMGLKDALYLLENLGIKVSVQGKGKVLNQSVTPGTVLTKDMSVVLELDV